jgi:hypothetical protein
LTIKSFEIKDKYIRIIIKIMAIVWSICFIIIVPFILSKQMNINSGSLIMDWVFGVMLLGFLTMMGSVSYISFLGIERVIKNFFFIIKKRFQHDNQKL